MHVFKDYPLLSTFLHWVDKNACLLCNLIIFCVFSGQWSMLVCITLFSDPSGNIASQNQLRDWTVCVLVGTPMQGFPAPVTNSMIHFKHLLNCLLSIELLSHNTVMGTIAVLCDSSSAKQPVDVDIVCSLLSVLRHRTVQHQNESQM